MKLLADASLPDIQAQFKSPFELLVYENTQALSKLVKTADILVCRSNIPVNERLLHDSSIQCVASASSGIDHIDESYLNKRGISLIDAKGCNASAVADYVCSTLAYLRQQGLKPHRIGVIGTGFVGTKVIERLLTAHFDVLRFDPYQAREDNGHHYIDQHDLLTCDVLCIHANLHHQPPFPSYRLLDHSFLSQLKSDTVIINAARGGIVDEAALCALQKPLIYCTDVYEHEPKITPGIIDYATLCTPHIAGHSIEAKKRSVYMVSQKIRQHFGFNERFESSPAYTALPTFTEADWKTWNLNTYNPIHETRALKHAMNKKVAFLSLRAAHQHRHDFFS